MLKMRLILEKLLQNLNKILFIRLIKLIKRALFRSLLSVQPGVNSQLGNYISFILQEKEGLNPGPMGTLNACKGKSTEG